MSKPSTTELDGTQDSTSKLGTLFMAQCDSPATYHHLWSDNGDGTVSIANLYHIEALIAEKVREENIACQKIVEEEPSMNRQLIGMRQRITALTPNTPKGEK